MAELRSQDKRDKLRLLYAQTKATNGGQNKPLLDLLMDALKACDEAISGATPGTWLSSSSENGGSSSFSMLYDFSPIQAKRLIGEMLDAYDYTVSKLTSDNGAAPSDADIYNFLMTSHFRTIRRFRSDFTGARYGIGSQLGTS